MENKLNIRPEIIAKTEKCDNNFTCLVNPKESICEVSEAIGGEILFICNRKRDYCNYSVDFGNNVLCHCPTRKEIFRKYHV